MSGDSPAEYSHSKKRSIDKLGMGLEDDFRASCGQDSYILPGKNTTPKRKVISSKPNLFVKRRENISYEDNESSAHSKLRNDRLLGHLHEHLQMRNDGNEDNSIRGNPHALMKPTPSIVDHLGLDLTPTLQNVVSTVNLGCILDLQRITFCTRMSEYNPSRFSGVVMRIREPHTTALVFKSGKVVVTGAKTEGEAHLASRKYGRIIQKLGFDVKFLDFKIQNIVGTYDLKFPLRVENLNQVHGQFCRYEPELFPGLIYRLVKPRVVLLIFVNGKIVLTGARNRSDLKEALQIMYPVLKSFKKDQESSE